MLRWCAAPSGGAGSCCDEGHRARLLVWRRRVGELAGGEAWIIDGNYSGTLDVRLAACDTVIFLDLPRAVCLWRVLKRALMYKGSRRPDMAEGCREKFDLSFLIWIWNYPSRTRPKVVELLKQHSQDKKVVRLRSRAEVEKFLAENARDASRLATETQRHRDS